MKRLRTDLTRGAAPAPFLAHVRRAVGLTDADPYGELTRHLSVHRGAEAQVFRTIGHVDVLHLARRARADALVATGLRDTICPPSTAFAAFNRYGELSGTTPHKEMAVYPYNHHEGGEAVHVERQLGWLRERLDTRAGGSPSARRGARTAG